MFRGIALSILLALLAGCVQPGGTTIVRHEPWDSYASALEEAVWRFEREADHAARLARPLPGDRWERLLGRSLRARGHTLQEFRALVRTAPYFYLTQQARYVLRLEDAEVRAAAGVGRAVDLSR